MLCLYLRVSVEVKLCVENNCELLNPETRSLPDCRAGCRVKTGKTCRPGKSCSGRTLLAPIKAFANGSITLTKLGTQKLSPRKAEKLPISHHMNY